ncbi:MAG: flagellar basal body L-ring protein FlgH [Deltaproteobacteria bacterium]|nr:flagellar basal body L-ring protein FlgH [Deltaproteobacteria bacterium]
MERFWSRTELRRFAVAVGLASLGLSGCLSFFERDPVPVLGGEVLIPPPTPLERSTGSLWRNNVSANYPFTDVRAGLPGDLLTVVVLEDDSGAKEAATDTESTASVLEGISQFFGLPQQLQKKNPDIDPAALIQADSERTWEGSGATVRKGRLQARMTVEVKAIGPTGNLWVQGDKIVAVNNEDQHVVLSGWVRPVDINARNEVESTRLADARIDYYGIGEVGRQQRAGWGMVVLDWVWPF